LTWVWFTFCASTFASRILHGLKPRNHPSRCTRKKHPPTEEKTHHLTFEALTCSSLSLTVFSRLTSSAEKLPDNEMHDYTPTDTENVYRTTLMYFAVNFTRDNSARKRTPGVTVTRWDTHVLCFFFFEKGKHIHISHQESFPT